MEFEAFSSTSSQALPSCDICGRNFNPEALQRHAPICAKSQSKNRKVFNSSKQRLEGTEAAPVRGRAKPKPPHPVKKSNWRAQHEDFINAIRSAKGVQKAIDSGGPLPPPPPPSINPDYIQCQHCARRFNQKAIERHLPFCAEQHSRLPNKKEVTATASRRAEARLQYKAPKLKSRSSGGGPGTYSYPEANSGPSGIRTMKNANNANANSGGTAPLKSQSSTPKQGGHYPGFKGMNGSHGNNHGHSKIEAPGSGRALRTGRTTETYSEARELSAKQRGGLLQDDMLQHSRYSINSSRLNVLGNNPSGAGYKSASRGTSRAGSGGLAKFCHECGTKFPVPNARFCVQCGCKRPSMT